MGVPAPRPASRVTRRSASTPPAGHPAPAGAVSDQLFLLLKEYDYLQAAIDKIDGQRFQIRNWAIAAAGALFTVSLTAKVPLAALAGSATTIFFGFWNWYTCSWSMGLSTAATISTG